MYDVIRASYRFHCPRHPHGELHSVALSRFRSIERLPGAAHPAVFRVTYRCDCGDDHVGLVSHDDLDYAPIGAAERRVPNLLTGRTGAGRGRAARAGPEPGAEGQLAVAAVLRPRGEAEAGVPVQPDAWSARPRAELGGVAMRCPSCGELSLNVVTESHLDVPFYHDRTVRLIDRPFGDRRDLTVERSTPSCGRPASTPPRFALADLSARAEAAARSAPRR